MGTALLLLLLLRWMALHLITLMLMNSTTLKGIKSFLLLLLLVTKLAAIALLPFFFSFQMQRQRQDGRARPY